MSMVIMMGVSGSGKTLVGGLLAERFQVPFTDADDFHSEENKSKMGNGIPLTDEDRLPWLLSIHNHIKSSLDDGKNGIIACSALKKNYRNIIVSGHPLTNKSTKFDNILFVHLKGSIHVIKERLLTRRNHYMPASLLESQMSALEELDQDENHVTVCVDNSVDDIVNEIVNQISNRFGISWCLNI